VSVVVEVARQVTDELLRGINSLLPQLSSSAPLLSTEVLQRLIRSDASTLFVARNDGVIVGTLTLVVFPIPTGLRAWIEDVVVDQDARGLGAGEALTLAAIDEARRRDVRSIDLTSRSSREAANALYQKLGFSPRSTNVYRFNLESH
jgi:ribosomal protein S18 acetylase RimI-like enzyme